MADKTINITLNIDDKGSVKIKGVNDEIKKLGDNSKNASKDIEKSWTEMNQMFQLVEGKLKQVYQAFKKTYEFAREGAELEFTINKFDRLSESIGTTTDALLKDLKKATDGTMSDMELMGAATDFMTLGLAKSHDEVVRLTSVASQLGMNMNQLVLTLTNQTTMRFDALGVAVDGFDDKVKTLKDSGMNANDAFNEAFLQQAEEQILKVGSVTDETLGTFMRFEAAIDNLAVTTKIKAAPALENLIKVMTDGINVLGGNKGWSTLLDDVNDAIDDSIPSYDDYRNAINRVLEETGLLVDENGKLIATNIDGAIKLGVARQQVEYLTEEEWNLAKAIDAAIKSSEGIIDTNERLRTSNIEAEESTNILKDATNNAEAAMRKYNEALLFKIASEGLSDEAALGLAYAMGLVDESTVLATEKTKLYKGWLDQKLITEGEYYELIKNVNKEIQNMPESKTFDLFVNIHGLEGIESLTSMGGGGSSGGGFNARASGGDVRPGGSYLVGEHGMELLQLGADGKGMITPLNSNVTNNFNLGVTTMQSLETVQTGFAILQAMQ